MTQISSEDHGLQSSWPTEPAGPAPKKRSRLWFMRELPALLVMAFAVAFLLKTLLVQAFYIPSESMEPTLWGDSVHGYDRVLVNKLAFRFRDPRRGEVLVFIAHPDLEKRGLVDALMHSFTDALGVTPPKDVDFIKRLIGLPGDTITVTDTGVFIKPPGGTKFRLNEPYISNVNDSAPCGGTGKGCPYGPAFGPYKVPAGMYFMMGDNRDNSSDSRSSLGPIPRNRIIGKAFVRIWQPKHMGILHVPGYPQPRKAPATKKPAKAPRKRGAAPLIPPAGLVAVAVGSAMKHRRGTKATS